MDRLSAALPAHKSAFFSASAPLRARAVAPPPPRAAASPSALPPISNIFFLRPRAPPPPPPSQEPQSTGKVPAPGRYGGAPLDKRIRQSWGGKKEDPLESGEYIWNTEWKKTVTVDDADKDKAAAEDPIASAVSSNDPSTSDGFLSLGRSLALDSMDVDLSAELSRPSKATLEKPFALHHSIHHSSTAVPPSHHQIPPSHSHSTNSMDVELSRPSKATLEKPLPPSNLLYHSSTAFPFPLPSHHPPPPRIALTTAWTLVLTTLGLGVVFTGTAAVLYSPEIAVSYAVGAVGSLVYVRMLSSSVEALGASSVQGAVRGAVGQPRLLVPVVLVMTFNRWNEILVPQYGAVPLELIPMLVGFFTYKAATITQALQDMLAPLAPPSSSSSSSSSKSSYDCPSALLAMLRLVTSRAGGRAPRRQLRALLDVSPSAASVVTTADPTIFAPPPAPCAAALASAIAPIPATLPSAVVPIPAARADPCCRAPACSAGPSAAPPTSSAISPVPVHSACPAYPAHPSRSAAPAYPAYPAHSAHSAHPSRSAYPSPRAHARWYGGHASGKEGGAGEEEVLVLGGQVEQASVEGGEGGQAGVGGEGGDGGDGGEAGGDDVERREGDVEAGQEEGDASVDLSWHPSGLVLHLAFLPSLPSPSPFTHAHSLLTGSSPFPTAPPYRFLPSLPSHSPFTCSPLSLSLSLHPLSPSPRLCPSAPMRPLLVHIAPSTHPGPYVIPPCLPHFFPSPSHSPLSLFQNAFSCALFRLILSLVTLRGMRSGHPGGCCTPPGAASGRIRSALPLSHAPSLTPLLLSSNSSSPSSSLPPPVSSPPFSPPVSCPSSPQPSARLPCLSPSEAAQLLTKGRAWDIRVLHVAGRCQCPHALCFTPSLTPLLFHQFLLPFLLPSSSRPPLFTPALLPALHPPLPFSSPPPAVSAPAKSLPLRSSTATDQGAGAGHLAGVRVEAAVCEAGHGSAGARGGGQGGGPLDAAGLRVPVSGSPSPCRLLCSTTQLPWLCAGAGRTVMHVMAEEEASS
ncbi:unnamed protein product [Closterium sp. NIES-54]